MSTVLEYCSWQREAYATRYLYSRHRMKGCAVSAISRQGCNLQILQAVKSAHLLLWPLRPAFQGSMFFSHCLFAIASLLYLNGGFSRF